MHFFFINTLHELFHGLSFLTVLLLVGLAFGSIWVFLKVFDSDFKMD